MQIVAGLSLKNLEPRVWDSASPYYLPELMAVMVSYADFHRMPAKRNDAMKCGLRKFLALPEHVKAYLDNGAFYFATNDGEPNANDYRLFVNAAQPDWRPIRYDAIPFPQMPWQTQRACFRRTMFVNRKYQHDGYVPVIHFGRYLHHYIEAIEATPKLAAKECIALGGLVPHLLRKSSAIPYEQIVIDLITVRNRFPKKHIHVFGIGGTATLHLAALVGFESVDSSGWRNRAARGLIQLPGCGDRMVAELGNWRGRRTSKPELLKLMKCSCPACKQFGIAGLRRRGILGFSNRATHNLWVLLDEVRWITEHLRDGTYARQYRRRLNNTIYLPLIERLVKGCHKVN